MTVNCRHTAHRHVVTCHVYSISLFFHNGAVHALTTLLIAVRNGVGPARAETQRHSVDIVMKVGITSCSAAFLGWAECYDKVAVMGN